LEATGEEKDAARSQDYDSLLTFVCGEKTMTIMDPMDLKSGWLSEEVRFTTNIFCFVYYYVAFTTSTTTVR